jgi:hypothetical protein
LDPDVDAAVQKRFASELIAKVDSGRYGMRAATALRSSALSGLPARRTATKAFRPSIISSAENTAYKEPTGKPPDNEVSPTTRGGNTTWSSFKSAANIRR